MILFEDYQGGEGNISACAGFLTLSNVFLNAFLSFSSLTACRSASFFSVSSMATALCSPRSRSSTVALST